MIFLLDGYYHPYGWYIDDYSQENGFVKQEFVGKQKEHEIFHLMLSKCSLLSD
jgi:hypothetical protein